MCNISGSNSQKRRGHFDFCAVKCKNHRLASFLPCFFVHKFDIDLGPTQSVLRIFARNSVQTCLGAPGRGSSRKKMGNFFLPTVNASLLLTSLKVCDWSGHIFAPSASPRPFNKILAASPSSAVHGGQYDATYVTLE